MIKITKFKAKIVYNFTEMMKGYWIDENFEDIDGANHAAKEQSFVNLAKRITGKEVIILKREYSQYPEDPDYWEQIDDNYPLPQYAFKILEEI